MGSSSAERRRCRCGFLSLRGCKSVFQYILIDLICQGKGTGSHGGSCHANGLGGNLQSH
jgi:hypothetical protein